MPLLLGYPALDKALQVCFLNASQRTRIITCWQCFCCTAQDIVGSLCHKGALLADRQLVHHVTHGLVLENCFPDGWPSACTGELGYFSPGAGVFLFTELHEIPLCPFLQPLPVPLNGGINFIIFTNLFQGESWTYQSLLSQDGAYCFVPSSQNPELHHLMVTTAKVTKVSTATTTLIFTSQPALSSF